MRCALEKKIEKITLREREREKGLKILFYLESYTHTHIAKIKYIYSV